MTRRLTLGELGIVPSELEVDLCRLGSPYGGWVFVHHPSLYGTPFLSLGAGEDISWDIEFAQAYGAAGFLVDPTPRAENHFRQVVERFGHSRTRGWSLTGKQPQDSYDVSHLRQNQLAYLPLALAAHTGAANFFPPLNPEHVSHTLLADSREHGRKKIEVQTRSPEDLLAAAEWSEIRLVKIDIEGAEVEVLPGLIENAINLNQVLVEFDYLRFGGSSASKSVVDANASLLAAGFFVVHAEGLNVSYFRQV